MFLVRSITHPQVSGGRMRRPRIFCTGQSGWGWTAERVQNSAVV